MNENSTPQKLLSFLQSALLKQKDVQQFLHFRPSAGSSEFLDDSLLLLLKESYSPDTGSRYITKGLLFRIFRILSTQYDFSLSKEQKQTMNWIVFEEISDYIRTHYKDIAIQDLVNEFHYQEDYFNRLIKRKTGLTYSNICWYLQTKASRRLQILSAIITKVIFINYFRKNTNRHLQITGVIQDNSHIRYTKKDSGIQSPFLCNN